MIFSSCILNRQNSGNWTYSDAGYTGNILLITEIQSFEKGLDEFLETSEGRFISRNFLKRLIERTLVGCENDRDTEVNSRIEWFKNHIRALAKERDYKVVKTLYGGDITKSEHPVRLGPLVFYEIPRHGGLIKLPFPDPFFCKHQATKTVAEYCAQAKDQDKALEFADTIFNAFDLSMAFLLAEQNFDFSIGILRMRFSPVQQPIVFTQGGLFGIQEANHNFKSGLDLTEVANFVPGKNKNTMLSFFNSVLSPETEIERKISRAVEWTGEAYLDSNRSSAFLKIVVALEALFKVDETGVITASIMASMAEQCAYLNGQSVAECLQIERYVKNLYKLRSKIVHTGSNSVRESELKNALAFTRKTIFNLLLLKNNLKFNALGELQNLIRESRYKACPLWQPAP